MISVIVMFVCGIIACIYNFILLDRIDNAIKYINKVKQADYISFIHATRLKELLEGKRIVKTSKENNAGKND